MIDAVEQQTREAETYIERLFAAHERRLGQFLVHVVRDRALAEDLLQETFLAAWRARDDLDEVEHPEDRALLVLAHVHGFGSPELAAMTGRSPAAIRKRLERARTALLQEGAGATVDYAARRTCSRRRSRSSSSRVDAGSPDRS